MTEDDVQLEDSAAEIFSMPLCDDEDEPASSMRDRSVIETSDDDVEAHGGSGFTAPAA